MEIKLKLKVKDVEIELTPEDAKELCKALQALVGEKEVIKEIHHDGYWPWVWTNPWSKYPVTWTTTYANTDKSVCLMAAQVS
jgi:hypothetical protein